MRFNSFASIALLCGIGLFLGGAGGDGCTASPTSDQQQRQAQEQLSKESNMQVGMPAIVNFSEKRMMKDILEKRDQMRPTYTYLATMNGDVGTKVCDSVGYGLPYSTQYTNPQRTFDFLHGAGTLPQADPNGLFSPASADGTWVMCKDPNGTKVEPIYIEPRIIVSPFKLK